MHDMEHYLILKNEHNFNAENLTHRTRKDQHIGPLLRHICSVNKKETTVSIIKKKDMKHLHLTLLALLLSFASFAIGPITGPSTVCAGSTITLSNITSGGTWSSSNVAVATIDATGHVTGVTSGTSTISYTDGVSTVLMNITVNPVPTPITGPMGVCLGSTITLVDTTTGGTWSSNIPAIAPIGTSTGMATGLSLGTTTISYTLPTGCAATTVLTVLVTPSAITGPTTVCSGTNITLTDVITGGTWISDDPTTVSMGFTSGIATGGTPGTATITYTLSTGCSATLMVTVLASPADITGPTSLCTGSTITLADATSGGTWTTSSTTITTVDPVSGDVTGVGPGISIINYTIPDGCMASTVVTVSSTAPAGPISGPIIVCTTNSITLTGFTPGGTWSSSTLGVGTINAATGVLTGIAGGTTTVSYTMPSSCGSNVATLTIEVDTIVSAGILSGTLTFCEGSTSTLGSTVPGGTWSSGNTSIATVGSSTGVVTGVAGGTADITYTTTLACGTSHSVITVTVDPLGVITVLGSTSICIGATTTLNGTPAFGTFATTSSIISVASWGEVTGVAAGAASVTYTTPAGCHSSIMITVYPPATAGTLSGPTSVCPGADITISSTVTGGTWSALNSHATVNPMTGVVTGMTPGLDTIEYTTTGPCGMTTVMWGVTVSAAPTAGSITGTGSVCVGLTTTLSNIITGGTWSSSSLAIATIGSSSGIVTGHAVGTSIITYMVNTSCGSVYTNTVVTVTPTTSSITGTTSICIGGLSTLASSVPGGTWSSAATFVATVNPTSGVVTGIHAGVAAISYALPGGCSSSISVTVNGVPAITASSAAPSCGGTIGITATGGISYTWSPSTGVACTTCGTTNVMPTGTMVYTVTAVDVFGCVGTATTTVDGNRIFGHIYYTGVTPASTATKVWLIHYNSTDSSIVDSAFMTTCDDAGIPYYEFDDKAPGNYLVKAKLLSSITGTSDYIPTYGSSNPSWYTATNVSHSAGTDLMNVTMLYGTVPAGPGFISGYVYAGAGKGTAGPVPVAGVLIFLRDAFSWDVKTYTYTDAAGAYSFSSIGTGSYIVYPEDYDFYTTPSAFQNIGSPYMSYTNVNFIRDKVKRTIKPMSATETPILTQTNNNITLYPNPSTGVITIEWAQQNAGSANMIVTDLLGRQVYNTTFEMSSASGKNQIDLSTLTHGVYFINIQSGNGNYSNKLIIE